MSAYAIEIFSLNVSTGIQQVYQSLVGLRVKTSLLKARLHSKPWHWPDPSEISWALFFFKPEQIDKNPTTKQWNCFWNHFSQIVAGLESGNTGVPTWFNGTAEELLDDPSLEDPLWTPALELGIQHPGSTGTADLNHTDKWNMPGPSGSSTGQLLPLGWGLGAAGIPIGTGQALGWQPGPAISPDQQHGDELGLESSLEVNLQVRIRSNNHLAGL